MAEVKRYLLYAIESEMFETVRYLVHKGADLYLLDDKLNMAEYYAKASNSETIISYIKHIVYMDTQIDSCETPLCKCG